MNTPMMLRGLAPSVRKMAMSARLSCTVITSVETRLNAATATISVRMMNIMRFSICTALNQVRFSCVQSCTIKSPVNVRASWAATVCARSMSRSLTRIAVGPATRKIFSASGIANNARVESY